MTVLCQLRLGAKILKGSELELVLRILGVGAEQEPGVEIGRLKRGAEAGTGAKKS
jgi:hypothetical protein